MAFDGTAVFADDPAAIIFQGRGVQGGPADEQESGAVVKNIGTLTVYLGGEGVDDTTGFPLEPGEAIPVGDVGTDDVLYGFASSATEVRVLAVL